MIAHCSFMALVSNDMAMAAPGALTAGAGSFHRSVCIDYLFYNNDGTLKRVVMTSGSVPPAK